MDHNRLATVARWLSDHAPQPEPIVPPAPAPATKATAKPQRKRVA